MLRRLAALAFGVAVIVGALAIRNADDGGGSSRRDSASGEVDPYDVFDDDPVTVLCIEELAVMCEDLDLVFGTTRVEPAWVTVDRLAAGGELEAEAWMTFRPLDAMAAPPGPAKGALGRATPVARSPIVLAGPPAAVAAVEAACPEATTLLSCAGATEGVQLMLRDPTTSAAGALALAVLAGEPVAPAPGRAVEPAAPDPLDALLTRARLTPVPYEDVARLKKSAIALTLEAEVTVALAVLPFEELRGYSGVRVLYPLEARAAEVVVVPARTFSRADDLIAVMQTRSLAYLLERSGFEVPPRRPGFLDAEAVFAARPTVRSDLPPPAPELLRTLRALRRPVPAGGGG